MEAVRTMGNGPDQPLPPQPLEVVAGGLGGKVESLGEVLK